MLLYLLKQKDKNIDINKLIYNDSLNLLKFLNDNNLLDNKQYLFAKCCKKGYINICKWLLSIDNETIFIHSCMNGQLDICKWLLAVSKNKINIHAEDDDAFISSCMKGHLNICKWLLTLDDKWDYMEDAFKYACWSNHIDICVLIIDYGLENVHPILNTMDKLEIYKNNNFVECLMNLGINVDFIKDTQLKDVIRCRVRKIVYDILDKYLCVDINYHICQFV